MPVLPFQIKICGVTNADDAQAAAQAGADAIGLNFYQRSKRYVDPATAKLIAASIPQAITKVGVFVNSAADEIRAIYAAIGLDYIQLHGDEPAELLIELQDMSVIRALRWQQNGGAVINQFLQDCSELGCMPAAILIDAHHPTEYGGTGMTADWSAISAWKKDHTPDMPIILAGGLNPTNVASAIEAVAPAAVDTASGVESSPGHKQADLVAKFVQASKQAFTKR